VLSAPGGLTYTTGIITTTTTYSILLNDSSKGTPAMTSCASITITATNGPVAVAVASATNPLTGAADPFAGTVYVANPCSFNSPSTCGSISVIDSDTDTVVHITNLTTPIVLDSGLIPFGAPINPHGIVADNVNELVYVSGNASYAGTTIGVVCDGSMATFSNRQTLNPLTTCTEVGNNPEGVAVGNNLGQVYVANNHDNTVSVLSTITLTLITTVPTGPGPLGVAVDQKVDLNTVYVTDNDGNTLTVLQPRASNTFAPSTVNVGFEPVGVVVNPGTDNVYVANFGSGTVTEIKGLTYNTVATINLPAGSKPTGIDIDTVSDTLYVADASTGTVLPISIPANTVGTPILVGSTPYGIALFLNPQSTTYPSLAYVTNSGSNTVSAIDTATNTVIATIFVP
jgi:YVTN family beta-propeller protein